MKDQHTKIKGYRDLSQEEIDLMNEIKTLGTNIEDVLFKVYHHVSHQYESSANNEDEQNRLIKAQPDEWLTKAKVDLQVSLMCLTRAVAQPTSF